MQAGRIVVLNGAPRAGKSSIVAAMQGAFDGVWLNLGVDVARQSTPARYQPGIGLRPGEPDHAAAALVPSLYAGWYEAIAAQSRVGLNVAAEFGHHDAAILADCARRLDGLPALFVGVRCPIDVILERRALTGKPIAPAPVQLWQDRVHVPGIYDLEVDTSLLSPAECAAAIRKRLDERTPPTAFRQLALLTA